MDGYGAGMKTHYIIREMRRLAEEVRALPDEACVTSAKNKTVCDYLSATNAQTVLRVLDYLLPKATKRNIP